MSRPYTDEWVEGALTGPTHSRLASVMLLRCVCRATATQRGARSAGHGSAQSHHRCCPCRAIQRLDQLDTAAALVPVAQRGGTRPGRGGEVFEHAGVAAN